MGEKNMMSSSSSTSVNDIFNNNRDYTRNLGRNDHNLPSSSDEISQFLRQILIRSSPQSYSLVSSIPVTDTDAHAKPPLCFASPPSDVFVKRGIPAVDFSGGGCSDSGAGLGPSVACFSGNALSSSVGACRTGTDEYDCESEEGFEAVVDDPPAKPGPPPRSSSKRSRAAEVHNLSEKRRRSRINEKMKALQNLIPNSNKTDKASMLDEAIEYLKQLQLQVQMLTMRNRLSLHSMSLPGGPLNHLQLPQTRMNLNDQFASSVPNIPEIINTATTSFGFESSFQSQFGSFPLVNSSKEITREDVLSQHRPNTSDRKTNLPGFEPVVIPTASLPLDAYAIDLKDSLA